MNQLLNTPSGGQRRHAARGVAVLQPSTPLLGAQSPYIGEHWRRYTGLERGWGGLKHPRVNGIEMSTTTSHTGFPSMASIIFSVLDL